MRIKSIYFFFIIVLFAINVNINAQNKIQVTPGLTFKPNVTSLKQSVAQSKSSKTKITNQKITLPLLDGSQKTFILSENNLTEEKLTQISTFNGISTDGLAKIKLNVTENNISGIIKTSEGYYIFEPYQTTEGEYRIYNSFEMFGQKFSCGADEKEFKNNLNSIANGIAAKSSVVNYPFGTNMRTFRMAVATTGEFTTLLGNQDAALQEVVAMMNIINQIFESELSITFQLISETNDKSLLFTDASTDPFTVDPSFASANNSQIGFTALNGDARLPYSKYDIGHTFHMLPALSRGWSAQGQAGPQPCAAAGKARAWSQWTKGAAKSGVANLIIHEMGHQFAAWHTYNAVGGNNGSTSFCAGGWSNTTAVEPGSGTTIMAYGDNCSTPTNYVNTGNNSQNYFHAKSVDQILANLSSSATCYSNQATNNLTPIANAGNVSITIPKATPFKLKGVGTDADDTNLSYTWDQNDLATTTGSKGAFGNTIAGADGKTAVQSTTAPLFRSEQSTATTERYFPKMNYVLNNANLPPTNDAEALPEVARDMNFRFSVRDNNGAMDSDNITVTVSDNGPLKVTYPNTAVVLNSGDNATITWDVNNSNTISSNVNVLLSTDGGQNFNIVLAQNTANDGSETLTVPTLPNTSKARIKVVAVINEYAEFFDVSDADFSISSSCMAYPSIIDDRTPSVEAIKGASETNLNLKTEGPSNNTFTTKQLVFDDANMKSSSYIIYNENKTAPNVLAPNFRNVLTPFKVSENGTYIISNPGGQGNTIMSVFKNGQINTQSFVSSNAYLSEPGRISLDYGFQTYLEKGVDYVLVTGKNDTTPDNSIRTINFSGPGAFMEITAPPAGVNYTYAAVNKTTQKITATNPTADFTTLDSGDYTVYGMSFVGSESTLVNKTFAELSASNVCFAQSTNGINLKITSTTLSTIDQNKNSIVLAPNPVKHILKISSSEPITHVEIYDISGKFIDKVNAKSKEVNFAPYKTGVYLVRLYNNSSLIYQSKVIKN